MRVTGRLFGTFFGRFFGRFLGRFFERFFGAFSGVFSGTFSGHVAGHLDANYWIWWVNDSSKRQAVAIHTKDLIGKDMISREADRLGTQGEVTREHVSK